LKEKLLGLAGIEVLPVLIAEYNHDVFTAAVFIIIELTALIRNNFVFMYNIIFLIPVVHYLLL
jgi:hypothetical protein